MNVLRIERRSAVEAARQGHGGPASLPVHTVAEFIAYAKAHPGACVLGRDTFACDCYTWLVDHVTKTDFIWGIR